MEALHVLEWIALAVAALSIWLSSIGLLLGRSAYDRLHFVGPAGLLGAPLIALAVVLNEGLSQASIKAVLVAIILLATGPVLTHATARAALVREHGRLPDAAPEVEQ